MTHQKRSYQAMLDYARTFIHPDATVRENQMDGNWEVVIQTNFFVSENLPDDLRGTPAWVLHYDDSAKDSKLVNWARKNGHNWLPLEGIAELRNIHEKAKSVFETEYNRLQEVTFGGPFQWDYANKDSFDEARELGGQATDFTNDFMKPLEAEFSAKWGTKPELRVPRQSGIIPV